MGGYGRICKDMGGYGRIGKDMKGRSPNEFICPSSIVAAAVNSSSGALKMEKCQNNAFNSLPFHNLINDHSTKKSSTNDETCLVSYIMECVRVSHEMDAEYRKISYNQNLSLQFCIIILSGSADYHRS